LKTKSPSSRAVARVSVWARPSASPPRAARVFITGRRQPELDKAAVTIEGNVTAIQGDASNLTDIDRIYQTVKAQAGRIDVLFVNAGFYEFGKFGEITEEHFDKTFNTNVRGLLFAVQKALPLGRLGTADEMGKVAVFLASGDSSYVNGVELFADGGVAQY
jgi:NAD(P)-dependent dehydrogenase (short-subunit alcohol dehydrogenase family)